MFLELNQTSVTTLFEYNISSNISAEGARRIASALFQDIYLIPLGDPPRPFRDFLLLLFSFLRCLASPSPSTNRRSWMDLAPNDAVLTRSVLEEERVGTVFSNPRCCSQRVRSRIAFRVLSRKEKHRAVSRSVDKHYPFTRSSLTDKPIIRHSPVTSGQLFYQSPPRDLLVGRRNDAAKREEASAGVLLSAEREAIIARNIIPG